jgi:hypothetical protein
MNGSHGSRRARGKPAGAGRPPSPERPANGHHFAGKAAPEGIDLCDPASVSAQVFFRLLQTLTETLLDRAGRRRFLFRKNKICATVFPGRFADAARSLFQLSTEPGNLGKHRIRIWAWSRNALSGGLAVWAKYSAAAERARLIVRKNKILAPCFSRINQPD